MGTWCGPGFTRTANGTLSRSQRILRNYALDRSAWIFADVRHQALASEKGFAT